MAEIVIDSSIIIGIAKLYKRNSQTPKNRRENFFFEVKDLIEDGVIIPVVTPTIEKEVRHGSKYDNGFGEKIISRFGKKYDFDEYDQNKTLELVDTYGNYMFDGDNPAIKNAEDSLSRNYLDARIVAEVSTLQKKLGRFVPLLTDNIGDICDERKISIINKRHGVPQIYIHSTHTVREAIEIAKKGEQIEK